MLWVAENKKGEIQCKKYDRKTYAFPGHKGTAWSIQLKLTEAHAGK